MPEAHMVRMLVRFRTCCLLGLLALWATSAAMGNPGKEPGPAVVARVESEAFLLTDGMWTPPGVYPLGKQDYKVVARMLDRAAMLATSTTRIDDAWHVLVQASDRVGVLFDAGDPPASLTLLDALLDRVIAVGVRPANVIVWADDERSLFAAGLRVVREGEGVRTMGAESEGYRDGVSRIAISYCDVVINLARLRPDRRIGMWGALANHLACVPEVERVRLLAHPSELPSAAARPSVRARFRLHLVDALQPAYEVGPLREPPYWNCGTLLASTDAVAVDVVGRTILEDKLAQVKGAPTALQPEPVYLKTATDPYRVGQSDPAKITVLHHKLPQ
jgi:hypothetical protein